ncbi:bifunctional phosphoribosylaminoimidazolecarboxamide formyltransferase/IMP cyclohydrolase [Sandaracinobacteroides saxicola]|uniref:Bifunctional purine biosynthesis protein PurH n=1 Tax=Sandaracinobacteroides saxicola TaxID=2759707 RepID=A0A7G5IHR2_9SPHN|nr:bifunctional phosphoribosylaminoimidazolecarboxamide formyltransferase/IMP cyclohydrolase [Sandaracinobacteroides saxicola]QMW22904.1 bifunctional phosphoribosylaminoimidazolecarboxamide formyltransferase/IMP cyclohydrolase [Sandaracinobacteroides saxicola]
MDMIRISRALLSVSDKDGLVDFARTLAGHGVELLSTGGTARALRDAGLTVTDVADHTGFPEMMDGRVKTLHPKVHGGLLALRDDAGHQASAAEHGIPPIDLVVVNLYPFQATVARGADRPEVIENIDIGGPSMVRSAAKNHAFVACVTNPVDYAALAEEMAASGALSLATRRRLAAKAFAATAAYDAAIASWFAFADQGAMFPDLLPLALTRAGEPLRYGENPHQAAAVYRPQAGGGGVASASLAQGKPLSYNNLNDADGAFDLIAEFRDAAPTIAIIKHANPCGVATAATLADAYAAAKACDPVSAFGGIIAANRAIDEATAAAILELFTEVVIAPDASPEARALFARKPNVRLLLSPLPDPARPGLTLRSIGGGVLVQSRDNRLHDGLTVVTARQPTDSERADMDFAWKVAKHVKSNAIVYASGGATAGIGAGQMSRVDSARIAAWKARDAAEANGWATPRTIGSAVASDAFFPFADGLEAAAAAGATAVIQPGGSMRDAEVIAAADRLGLTMAFTGIRHFRH